MKRASRYGYGFTINEYTQVDFDSYCNIYFDEDTVPKWYLKIRIFSKLNSIDLLLACVKNSAVFSNVKYINGISLIILKEKGGEYEQLKNQPISIREISICKGKSIVRKHGGNVVIMDSKDIITAIICDTLKEYLD